MAWRRFIEAVGLATLAALLAPVAAHSCSTIPGYVRPSNFELVQIADAVVVATPISVRDLEKKAYFDRKVVFRITQTLKGEVGGEIEVTGLAIGRTRPSDPLDILFSHPEGHMGPCNRITFAKGASYVLFVEKRGDGYATLGHPFSRVSEDYAGESSPWARTIRTYLRIQNTETPMGQVAALEAMRNGIANTTTPAREDQMLAVDIEQHLGSPSPWKPTEFLLAALDDLKAGRPPRYKARHPAFDAEQSEAAALTSLIMQEIGLDGDKPAPPRHDPRQTALLEMLIDGDHPKAMTVFDALAAPGSSSNDLAMALRYYAKNGRYREAYRLIEDRAVPSVETLSRDEAWTLLRAIAEAQQDSEYHEGPRRWRGESDIASRWPRLALKLSKTAKTRFDLETDFHDSLKSLLGADYRADPDLTLLLSGRSADITAWAWSEIARPENIAASDSVAPGTSADPLVLPLTIGMLWLGVGEDQAGKLAPVFCQKSPAYRRLIFELWGRSGSWLSGPPMLRLAAAPTLEDEDMQALAAAFPAWEKRRIAEVGSSGLDDSPAMGKLAKGQPITAKDIKPLKPIACPG